jgi:ABC-type lipoprotein export system ATPase subunit/ABC-type antimicrobial peptide transport system permease subunit
MIKLTDIRKTHVNNRNSQIEALRGVSLELPDTGFILITGDNGSGKTTLISIIGGLDSVTSGVVMADGQELSAYKQNMLDDWRGRDTAFLFQDYNLIADLTVFENVKLGAVMGDGNCTDDAVNEALTKIGISHLSSRYPKDLSGGEFQKAAIARAIVKRPKIMFVDEPTGQTDKKSTAMILDVLKTLSKDILVVCVSHDVSEVQKHATRIVTIDKGVVVKDKTLSAAPIGKKQSANSIYIEEEHEKPQNTFVSKLGGRYFLRNIGRIATIVLVTSLSLLLFTSSYMLSVNNRSGTLADTAIADNEPYFAFSKDAITETFNNSYKYYLTEDRYIAGVLIAPRSESATADIFGQAVLYGDATAVGGVLIPNGIAEKMTGSMPSVKVYRLDGIYQEIIVLSTETLVGKYFELNGAYHRIDAVMRSANTHTASVIQSEEGTIDTSSFEHTKVIYGTGGMNSAKLAKLIDSMDAQGFRFDSFSAAAVYDFTDKLSIFKNLFLGFALLLLFLSGVYLFNFISNLIRSKKKDIGILRALGAHAHAVIATFILTVSCIALSIFGLTTLLSVAIAPITNAIAAASLGMGLVKIVSFNVFTILIILGMCAIVTLAATLFPILRYSKKAPASQLKAA